MDKLKADYTHIAVLSLDSQKDTLTLYNSLLYPIGQNSLTKINDLEESFKVDLWNLLKREIKQNQTIVEVFVKINLHNNSFKKVFEKHNSIPSTELPKLLYHCVQDKILTEESILKNTPANTFSTWNLEELDTKDNPIFKGHPLVKGIARGRITKDIETLNPDSIYIIQNLESSKIQKLENIAGIILEDVGVTSHLALIIGNLNIPAVIIPKGTSIRQHSTITFSGFTGDIFSGKIKTKTSNKNTRYIEKITKIAHKQKKLKVMLNADSGKDLDGLNLDECDGIGLCRSEHMFVQNKDNSVIQNLLLSQKLTKKQEEEIIQIQENSFRELFDYYPFREVTIRLLDAPLNEFFPNGISSTHINVEEKNPMLGVRGVRMLIFNPTILKLQLNAILSAQEACTHNVHIKILLPMVSFAKEIEIIKNLIQDYVPDANLSIGTMLETPASLFDIDQIAKQVDFISFGTNDLTQMFYGLSRDDSESLIKLYTNQRVVVDNPFHNLTDMLLNSLIQKTIKQAKRVNANIQTSICGAQAASGSTIAALAETDLDAISVPPSKFENSILLAGKYGRE